MGCSGAREKLEDQMMLTKLHRMEIQMEKEKELKKLSEMEGGPVKRGIVPDYIDPVFAKEKNLYDDDDYMYNVKKTDGVIIKKGVNNTGVKAKTELSNKKVKRDKSKDKNSDKKKKKKLK